MQTQKPVIFLAFANDHVKTANYLRNLPKELSSIRQVLQKAVQADLCEVVERADATIGEIIDIFQDEAYKDRIAVFHYGGHANNYSLLLESYQHGREPAHKDGLVPFLARQNALQLVFLNGCATEQHALELIQAGVPSVIGTSQEINDRVAACLAIRFYNGLANGSSLKKAWRDAEDEIITRKGAHNYPAMYHFSKKEPVDRFPWAILIKAGAENVKDWNLPDAAGNPLFGLPPITRSNPLPETPFLFLNRYERKHAELFFGRSQYIRELYRRITDRTCSPIILVHGQSGVGKSSLLESGLVPRIEENCTVDYARRNRKIGLLGTLDDLLQNHLDQIAKTPYANSLNNTNNTDIESIEPPTTAEKWRRIESRTRKPLIIILDQVEEVFTRPNDHRPIELESLTNALYPLFSQPASYPTGKLILAYRKEYHPDIDAHFKMKQMERSALFVQPLNRQGIVEVVTGITQYKRLKTKYNMEVEDDLPHKIADDLLKDHNSPIAPTLQILLTKMWDTTKTKRAEAFGNKRFTVKTYRRLCKEGLLMEDFFSQQMGKLKAWQKEDYESGLALDVLKFHTTRWGTACNRSNDDIYEQYPHRRSTIDNLVKKLKDLYLLSDTPENELETVLAHDILAPVVIEEYNNSHLPGQRAARILAARIEDFNKNPHDIWLNKADLKIVENGKDGTRTMNRREIKLLEKSKQRLKRSEIKKITGLVSLLIVTILAVSAAWKWKITADREQAMREARVNTLVSQALHKEEENPTIAIRLLDAARKINNNHIIIGLLNNIYREHKFYKIIIKQDSPVTAMAFLPNGRGILTGDRDGKIRIWDQQNHQLKKIIDFDRKADVLAFSPDGRYTLSRSMEDGIVYLQHQQGNVIRSFKWKGRRKSCAAFSHDSRCVAIGLGDQTVRLWDMEGNVLKVLKGHEGSVTAIAFSPDNNHVLTGSMDNYIRLWNKKGTQVHNLGKYKENAYSAAFSPDGEHVLLGMERGLLLLCTLKGEVNLQLIGHRERINHVTFSPCGNFLLTASDDKTARVWDRRGNQIYVCKGHKNCINCATFSADGNFLFTGSSDKTVRAWNLRTTMGLEDFLAKGTCERLSKKQNALYGIGKKGTYKSK